MAEDAANDRSPAPGRKEPRGGGSGPDPFPDDGRDIRFPRAMALLGLGFGAAGLAVALLMILWAEESATAPYPYRAEAFKALLQLLLVTGLGGILVGFLGWLRDRESIRTQLQRDRQQRREARVAALQTIDRELGSAYRALKAVKRQLRSHLVAADRDDEGKPGPPYEFATGEFRKTMADLLVAQIRAEDLRDHIAVRTDLFDEAAIRSIRAQLHYAARFFHDVHEDLERGKVDMFGDVCRATDRCCNIDSLINSRSYPADLHPEVETALCLYLEIMKHPKSIPSDREEAIDLMEQVRKLDSAKRRFRAVADDCFALASAEIRRQIGKASDPAYRDEAQFAGNRSYQD